MNVKYHITVATYVIGVSWCFVRLSKSLLGHHVANISVDMHYFM
jgi:hypothetical protein